MTLSLNKQDLLNHFERFWHTIKGLLHEYFTNSPWDWGKYESLQSGRSLTKCCMDRREAKL